MRDRGRWIRRPGGARNGHREIEHTGDLAQAGSGRFGRMKRFAYALPDERPVMGRVEYLRTGYMGQGQVAVLSLAGPGRLT